MSAGPRVLPRADLVSIVEASYALDASDTDWLDGIVQAAQPSLPKELGVCAYLFDASVRPVRVWSFVSRNAPASAEEMCTSLADMSDHFVEDVWMAGPACALASELPGFCDQPHFKRFRRDAGIADWLAVCAHGADGRGCFIGAPLRKTFKLRSRERDVWERIGAHLTTAMRLRNRLAHSNAIISASAVLTPKGKIEDLSSDAAHAREALQKAALAMAIARGSLRSEQPARAVANWRVLVSAQWSLVDHFDSDGKRYLVAQANQPATKGPDTLTEREKQVLALASLGRVNKINAYELGLSASTVRVHLANAAQKLGATSRRAAIAEYTAFQRRSQRADNPH